MQKIINVEDLRSFVSEEKSYWGKYVEFISTRSKRYVCLHEIIPTLTLIYISDEVKLKIYF